MTPEALKEWKQQARSDPEAYKVLLDWSLENGQVKSGHSREALQARFEAWLSGESLWIIRYRLVWFHSERDHIRRTAIIAIDKKMAVDKLAEIHPFYKRIIISISKEKRWDPPLTYTPIERKGWLE